MKLHVLPAGLIQTNAYVLSDPVRGEAILIDAPAAVWPAVQRVLQADGSRLVALWLTHGHWDHIQGVPQVVRETGVTVSGHPADRRLFEQSRELLRQPGVDPSLLPPGIEAMEPVRIDHWLADGERGEALGQAYEVRHVPGHCPGNVLFHFPGLQAAFVGDALFRGSVGRTDLPGGNAAELTESIRSRIYSLPGATAVYPGHGPATTVDAERTGNPFVRAA
ncbi:MAG TPA: MBL fold metallo-hydrolase [Opitutaceae bacterium]|nr:MBL fold metallo-hydrolase [Opitutaceae bacterium]